MLPFDDVIMIVFIWRHHCSCCVTLPSLYECWGRLVTMWPWSLSCDLENLSSWDLLWSCITAKYDYNIHSQHRNIGFKTCPLNQPLLNMNIEGIIKNRTVTSPMTSSCAKTESVYIICHLVFISEVKLKPSCKITGILKILGNDFDVRSLMIFHTKTETGTWVSQEDVPLATYSKIWQYLFPQDTIKTDIHMTFSKFDLILSWWYRGWRHGCVTHNVHNYTSPPIYLHRL